MTLIHCQNKKLMWTWVVLSLGMCLPTIAASSSSPLTPNNQISQPFISDEDSSLLNTRSRRGQEWRIRTEPLGQVDPSSSSSSSSLATDVSTGSDIQTNQSNHGESVRLLINSKDDKATFVVETNSIEGEPLCVLKLDSEFDNNDPRRDVVQPCSVSNKDNASNSKSRWETRRNANLARKKAASNTQNESKDKTRKEEPTQLKSDSVPKNPPQTSKTSPDSKISDQALLQPTTSNSRVGDSDRGWPLWFPRSDLKPQENQPAKKQDDAMKAATEIQPSLDKEQDEKRWWKTNPSTVKDESKSPPSNDQKETRKSSYAKWRPNMKKSSDNSTSANDMSVPVTKQDTTRWRPNQSSTRKELNEQPTESIADKEAEKKSTNELPAKIDEKDPKPPREEHVQRLKLVESSRSVESSDAPSHDAEQVPPKESKDESTEGKEEAHTDKTTEEETSQNESLPEAPPQDNATGSRRNAILPPRYALIPQQQQQQPTMIVVGGPSDGRLRPSSPPSTSAILAELIASIVSAAVRIWFLTSLTKWWAEEETMKPLQHFVWERLNDRYAKDEAALQTALQAPPPKVSERKWRQHMRKKQRNERNLAATWTSVTTSSSSPSQLETFDRTVIVVELGTDDKGQAQAINIPHLEQVVTFLLSQHRQKSFGSHNTTAKELEVVILVESPGGAVQDFGLAASQVGRLSREPGIVTTVCVDKVAASGGYMVASQAHTLVAAPFAVVGSIGVIREGFNLHDVLQKYGIQPLVLKAGHSKAPLTTMGAVTPEDLETAQRTLDSMHVAFQKLVVHGRPMLAETVEDVCNGDIYLGQEAVELSLVDRVATSEEYLLERIQAGDRVLKLHRAHSPYAKHRKLFSPLDLIMEKSGGLMTAWNKLGTDMESIVSRVVTATSVAGFVQYLIRQRIIFGSDP